MCFKLNFKTYPVSPNAPSNWIDKKSTKIIVYQKCNYLITYTLAHTLFKLWKSFGILYCPVYINVIPWRMKHKGKGSTYRSFYRRPQFIFNTHNTNVVTYWHKKLWIKFNIYNYNLSFTMRSNRRCFELGFWRENISILDLFWH